MATVARSAFRTHGETGTRLYRIWQGMISRCGNPNDNSYQRYGARGIKIYWGWCYSYRGSVPGH
jgi:hypothetical protein